LTASRHRIEGEPVRVYSLPKTIADCFKYRNKLGMEVVLKPSGCLSHRRVRMADLDESARVQVEHAPSSRP
jgi:hypothetical protein